MNNKDNIIFIGYIVPLENTSSYSGISIAGNKMQNSILKHLYNTNDYNISIISIRPNASFPRDKRIFVRKNNSLIYNSIPVTEIGYINVPLLKQLTQCRNVFKVLKKQIKSIKNKCIVFTFNMFPPIGIPAIKVQEKYKTQVVAFLADLPIDDAVDRSLISRLLDNSFNSITERQISKLKNAIALNLNAIKTYAPNSKYLVIDGGIELDENTKYVVTNKENYIMYCGSLNKYSGVLTLCQAMEYVKDDVLLYIYGQGELKEQVLEYSNKDNRIKYNGLVPNSIIIEKQKKAKLLINPRPVNDQISMVTFPSKIFEYMLSGTPIVSTKLSGFSSEYDDKLIFCGDSAKDIGHCIDKTLSLPKTKLDNIGKKAFEYVIKEKTWENQINKIVKFIGRCYYEN